MESAIRVQILDEAICISHCEKGVKQTIFFSAMGKIEGQTSFLALVWQPA